MVKSVVIADTGVERRSRKMGNIGDEKCYLYGSCKCQTAGCVVRPDNGCPVYRYFKNLIVKDYETRLKADMAAMLEELKKEIEELWDNRYDVWLDNQYYIGKSDTLEEVDEVIQQKINALKGDSDGD